MVETSLLNGAQKTTVYERQRLETLQRLAQSALGTGRKINQVSDNPVDFYRAENLSNRVNDIQQAKSNIDLGVESLNAAQIGLDAIEDLSRQLQGVAISARSASADQKIELSAQFNTIRNQINNIAQDTSLNGTGLLTSTSDSLSVNVGSNSSVNVSGRDASPTGLGIKVASGYNGFATSGDIDAAIADIAVAVESTRSQQSSFAGTLSTLNIRGDANARLAETFQGGVDKLVNADLNEEAARSLALSIRAEFSTQSQRILNQSQSLLVSLVGSNG